MASPVCLSLVLCDTVLRDLTTNKCTLAGTYNTVFFQELPHRARLCMFFEITNGHGKTPIKVRVVEAAADLADDSQAPVGEGVPVELDFSDPLQVIEVAATVVPTFNSAGLYHCEVVSGSEVIASRRIVVRPVLQE